jgi:hypothetical protein
VLRFIGIGVISILALIGAGFIVLLAWAWHFAEESEVAEAQGADFGGITNDQACLTKVVDMVHDEEPWIVNLEVEFLRACLKSAGSMPGFCDNVPPPSDEEIGKSWRLERCQALSLEEVECHMILSTIQYHCVEWRAQATK